MVTGRRGRPPPVVQPSDEDELDPDEQAEADGDVEREADPSVEPPKDPDAPPPPRRVAPSPLDERAAAPGGGRFVPPGFGGMGPGANRLPPLQPPSFFQPGAAGMMQPPIVRRMEPQQQGQDQGGYGQDAEPFEAEALPPGDEGRIRAVLGEYKDDLPVNVRVMQAGPGYLLPRGFIENCLLSWARYPERYIPFGGEWHLQFESAMTGHVLRNGRKSFILPGPELPLSAEWRVDVMLEDQRKLKTMWELMNSGGGGGLSIGGGGGIPQRLYDNETGYQKERADRLERELATAREQAHTEKLAAMQRDFDFKLEMLRREKGGNGGDQNQVLATITALTPFLANRGGGAIEEKMLDAAMRMNGPEMMLAQGEFFNKMMEAQAKYLRKGDGDDDGILGMVKPALKDWGTQYIAGMQKRQQARDDFMMERQRAKEEREARATRATAQTPAAAPAAAPTTTTAASGNGRSTNRLTFERTFDDVKLCLFNAANQEIAAEKRPTARDAGRKLGLCMLTALETKLWEGEETIKQLIGEAIVNPETEVAGNPEQFIGKLCMRFGLSPDFAMEAARSFRGIVGLPALENPTAPPVAAAPPVVEKPTAASQPVPAPSPEPVEHPVVVSSTIRLSDAPPEKPKEPAPESSAANTEPAPVPSQAPTPAPVDAPGPDSPQVEAENAVAGEVGEPQGAVHVVDVGAEVPAADREQKRDAKGKRRKASKKDGVGLEQPPSPPAEVEKPAVP